MSSGASAGGGVPPGIGRQGDPEATGDGSLVAITKRNRTLLTTIAGAAIITGGVITAGRLDTAPAKATAAAPTYVEGSSVPLSTDLAGALRTAGGGGGGGNPTAGRLDSIRRIDTVRTLANQLAGRLDSVRRVDTVRFARGADSLFSWLGSTAPTVGQKTMASSLPVTIASNQSNVSVTCVSGCSGAAEAQTYIAAVRSSAAAASKDHLNLFNASGSGKVIRVLHITTAPDLAAAVTGLVQSFIVQKTSTVGATCTAVTIRLYDNTNAAVPAQVTASTNCTTDPTSSFDWLVCAQDGEETRSSTSFDGACYEHKANGGQPFTLREGEGISIRSGALSGAWPVAAHVTFSM